MKKIGIVTPYKGYNFGTSLQAYAVKEFISSMGYQPYVIGKKSFINGRDVSFEKVFVMFVRSIIRPKVFKNTFFSYKNNLTKDISSISKNKFIEFQNELDIHYHSYSELKKLGKNDEFLFFICGSDQIWNTTNLYLDPLYYLQFAPDKKKVAFSPSFGKKDIPEYNFNPIKKRIISFFKLSSREESGVNLIGEMTKRKADCLVDPTLLLDKTKWQKLIKNKKNNKIKYILLYFLDTPNDYAIELLKELNDNNYELISLNYTYEQFKNIGVKKVDAGPKEFLEYINGAEFVLTDSFHGTVFSINFHKNFYVFNRNYGTAVNQSTRIVSILNKCKLSDRLINSKVSELLSISNSDYEEIDEFLVRERVHAEEYLLRGVVGEK